MVIETGFQVLFPPEPGTAGLPTAAALDVLGLWQVETAAQVSGIVWRADLPSDELLADQILADRVWQLSRARLALEDAPACLDRDLRLLTGPASPDEVAFDLQSQPPETARGVLQRAWLYRIDAQSFGDIVDGNEVEGITGLVSQFNLQVRRLVGQLALVETASGGGKQALTRVAWSGSVDTWYAPQAWPRLAGQHRAHLEQSLATRQGWLRFLLLFSTAVLRVGIALSTPVFFPLTIWTTWKYLQGLVTEYRQLQNQISLNATSNATSR